MTLQFKHFDTRLKQWIANEVQSHVDDPILTEKLDNTLLELYFPDMPFSFGHIDEKIKLEELYKHPDGHVLLLSSKNRLLYGPPECLETIEKLCPDRKDRGAYGSIFLGSCKNTVFKEMNILVVDNVTGQNGAILPDEIAWMQVGDCHGKVSLNLALALSGTAEHVIQHRLGIPAQFRFAKGTLAPKDLGRLPYHTPNTQVDLIIPTSSFKGGDKKNNPITPGLHTVKVWIGEKELSQRGKNAISQVHASFPSGIKDYLKELEKLAEKLQDLQTDPRQLAQYYCQKFELRKSLKAERDLENSTIDEEEEEREALDEINDDLMYRIIKADVESGHYQLLETQKVTDELQRFLRKEWLELAIGKAVQFDRGMIIPSKDLKHGEICVPWLSDGEEVLNFRSPFLNSNGMCVSINRLVPDALAPNGNPLKGVIVVNDEDHQRIIARIDALKAQGIQSDEIDPIETESERQGRDYDGDCIAVALALDFPYLTAEAKRRNEPKNAYAPVKKEEKVSFYRNDGSQPDFEEIADFMSDSISVGVINNHATALEALESEIDILNKYGTFAQTSDYVRQVGSHYQNLIVLENADLPKPIPAQYRDRILQVAQISQSPIARESINLALTINRSIYHDMIGEAGYQNQLAVDIFKSNRAPDMAAIALNNRLLHRIPNQIRDKKKTQMYLKQAIDVQGFSPVELMVRQANTYFSFSPLLARPTEQFRDLFPENYNSAQYNQATLAKAQFDKLFGAAVAAKIKLRHETGPVLKVLTKSGKQLEITNLIKFDHPLAFSANQLNISLVENQAKNAYHKLLALAQVPGEVDSIGNPVYKRLGTVCSISRSQLGLRSGIKTDGASCKLASALTKSQVQLLFKQANDYAATWKKSIAESDWKSMAAAAWHVSTTHNNNKEAQNRISNFAFAAFGKEIIEQLSSLQLTSFVVSQLREHNQTPPELWQSQTPVPLLLLADREGKSFWYVSDPSTEENHKLGVVSLKGAQLPHGTKAQGTIRADEIATATLNIPGIDRPITFGKVNEHDFANVQFKGESVRVIFKQIGDKSLPILKLDGKEIGELDSRSVEMLAGANRLKEGMKLEVVLNTLGKGNGTYTLATTALGNTIRVNRQAMAAYPSTRFSGETAQVTVSFKQSKPAMGVWLEVDGVQKLAGIFTINHKSSKEALIKANLWKDGCIMNATITSNITVAHITIDPNSLQYPALGQWVNSDRIRYSKEPTSIEKNADTFLGALKKLPSLLHRLDLEWTLRDGSTQEFSTLGLTVDGTVKETTSKWLTAQNIPHFQVDPKDLCVEAETVRGYVVFRMKEADVSASALALMQKQCGEILEANLIDVANISPYYQKLEMNGELGVGGVGEVGEDRGVSSTKTPRTSSTPPAPHPTLPIFVPPALDVSKWPAVKEYLTLKRGLPEKLVDELNQQGIIYADTKQNAVFLLKNIDGDGEITGASFIDTYSGSQFEGLAKNSARTLTLGWFSFSTGKGKLQRVVLVDSAIDAISAAALSPQPGKTVFISCESALSLPQEWLRQQSNSGIEILIGSARSSAGEVRAWKVASLFPSSKRLVTFLGKDWNEKLLFVERNSLPSDELNVSSWKKMAKALGKEDRYIHHIEAVEKQPLSPIAMSAFLALKMAYTQTQASLWKWLDTASNLGKEEAYLKRIATVALSFNGIEPLPLTEKALNAMQLDLIQYQQHLKNSLTPELIREAFETAASIKTFLYLYGTIQPNSTLAYTGSHWHMELNENTLALANNHYQDILRVEGEKVIVFNPRPEERELLKDLRSEMELEQLLESSHQHNLETSRRRGRGR